MTTQKDEKRMKTRNTNQRCLENNDTPHQNTDCDCIKYGEPYEDCSEHGLPHQNTGEHTNPNTKTLILARLEKEGIGGYPAQRIADWFLSQRSQLLNSLVEEVGGLDRVPVTYSDGSHGLAVPGSKINDVIKLLKERE